MYLLCWLRRFHVQVVEEAVEIPQLQAVKKIGVIPETFETSQLQLEGTQTSESLNTAFLRLVTQAEIGALSTSECGRSANMKRITQQQNNQPQAARQVSTTRERVKEKGGRKKEERRRVERVGCDEEGRQREQRKGDRGKEEEGRDGEEEVREQVKKDETG